MVRSPMYNDRCYGTAEDSKAYLKVRLGRLGQARTTIADETVDLPRPCRTFSHSC